MTTIRIPLSSRKYPGLYALIDEADFELVSQYQWFVIHPGGIRYAQANIRKPNGEKTSMLMHRLISGAQSGAEIDHADRDGLNNTRENLRIASRGQNMANTRRSKRVSTSVYRGVTPKRDKWRATITVGGKHEFLGSFQSEVEAARSYDKRAREVWGEFATLNFPDG